MRVTAENISLLNGKPEICEFKLGDDDPVSLIFLNDEGFSFAEIADILEVSEVV